MMRGRIRAVLHTFRGIRNLFEKKKVDHGKGSEEKQFKIRVVIAQPVRAKNKSTRQQICRAQTAAGRRAIRGYVL